MNYQEMTDFEINKAVAMAIGYSPDMCEQGWENSSKVGVEWENESGYPSRWFDYCNSWADSGPIAEDNEIGVVKVLNGWCATNDHAKHEGVFFVDPNPRRAICIAFLMMKGGE